MILFSLLIEKLNSWHSWHLGGSLFIPILCNADFLYIRNHLINIFLHHILIMAETQLSYRVKTKAQNKGFFNF